MELEVDTMYFCVNIIPYLFNFPKLIIEIFLIYVYTITVKIGSWVFLKLNSQREVCR